MYVCFGARCIGDVIGTVVAILVLIALVVTTAKTCWPCKLIKLCVQCSTKRLNEMARDIDDQNEKERPAPESDGKKTEEVDKQDSVTKAVD